MDRATIGGVGLLLAELHAIWQEDRRAFDDPDRCPFLGNHQERVRQIGAELNEIGGFDLMVYIAKQVPRPDQRELEYAWDGIGDWRA